MFLLALQLQGVTNPVIFKFNDKKSANTEFESVLKAIGPSDRTGEIDPGYTFFCIEDHWGHRRAIWSHHIENAALLDMAKDVAAQAEMAVLQARGQAAANRKVQNDPYLNLTAVPRAPLLSS